MAAAVTALPLQAARAGVEDWQISEVLVSSGGNPEIRYIEIFNPVGGCLFPTTRVEVLSAQGTLVGAVTLAASTQCFDPGTYLLLATTQAAAAFNQPTDVSTVPAIPAAAAQVCITSSSTRYDCTRYGAISQPITDLFGSDDTSAEVAPPDSLALVRIATTNVVIDDFAIQSPTPRSANTGMPWTPPDAGPIPDAGPDAGPLADAGPIPDAGPRADAAIPMRPWDARPMADAEPPPDAGNTRFLDLDATGGACACQVGTRPVDAPWGMAALAWALMMAIRVAATRSRRRSRKNDSNHHDSLDTKPKPD